MTAEAKNKQNYLQELKVLGLYTGGPLQIEIDDLELQSMTEKAIRQGASFLEAVGVLLNVRRDVKWEPHWKADVLITELFRTDNKHLPSRKDTNKFLKRNKIPLNVFNQELKKTSKLIERTVKFKAS